MRRKKPGKSFIQASKCMCSGPICNTKPPQTCGAPRLAPKNANRGGAAFARGDSQSMPVNADADGDGVVSYEEMRQIGRGRAKAPDAGAKQLNRGSSAPGGATDTSKETPRPDGPKPTEQQINMGPYAGRHTGGWKMKDELLEPDSAHLNSKSDDGNGDRHISMSNVHGTWFSQKELQKRWFVKHNTAKDSKPAETIHERLYPLDRQTDVDYELGDTPGLSYSPWEPTVSDCTPMSKTIGSYAMASGPVKAAIQPQAKPPNNPPRTRPPIQPTKPSISCTPHRLDSMSLSPSRSFPVRCSPLLSSPLHMPHYAPLYPPLSYFSAPFIFSPAFKQRTPRNTTPRLSSTPLLSPLLIPCCRRSSSLLAAPYPCHF